MVGVAIIQPLSSSTQRRIESYWEFSQVFEGMEKMSKDTEAIALSGIGRNSMGPTFCQYGLSHAWQVIQLALVLAIMSPTFSLGAKAKRKYASFLDVFSQCGRRRCGGPTGPFQPDFLAHKVSHENKFCLFGVVFQQANE